MSENHDRIERANQLRAEILEAAKRAADAAMPVLKAEADFSHIRERAAEFVVWRDGWATLAPDARSVLADVMPLIYGLRDLHGPLAEFAREFERLTKAADQPSEAVTP